MGMTITIYVNEKFGQAASPIVRRQADSKVRIRPCVGRIP